MINSKVNPIRCRDWEFLPCGLESSADDAVQAFMRFRESPLQSRLQIQHDFIIRGYFAGPDHEQSARVTEFSRASDSRLDQGLKGIAYCVNTADGAAFIIDERDMSQRQLIRMCYARTAELRRRAI